MTRSRRAALALVLLVTVAAAGDTSFTVLIDFEGLPDFSPVGTIAGDLDVDFGDNWASLIKAGAGGSGNFDGEPSPVTAAATITDPGIINFPTGVLEVSFFHASLPPLTVTAYTGENGTGTVVGSVTSTEDGTAGCLGATFCNFVEMAFSATDDKIRSLVFDGVFDNSYGIDDLRATTDCSGILTPDSAGQGWFGGTETVDVVIAAGCQWNATSLVPWIEVTGGASGTGSGTVTLQVGRNEDGVRRIGEVTIADQAFTVVQNDYGCDFSLSPQSLDVSTLGGTATVMVDMESPACTWSVGDLPSWVSPAGATDYTGPALLMLEVDPNLGNRARRGSLTIAGLEVDVDQDGTTDAATPTAPSDLGLSTRGTARPRAILSWTDRSGNEAGFVVTRLRRASAAKNSMTFTGLVEAPVTFYVEADTERLVDRGLEPGVEYCYEVRAYNAGGPSRPLKAKGCITTGAAGRGQ